MQKLTSLANY